MNKITARDIATALGGGKEVKQSETRWNTICPAHNDKGPSLTVSEGNGGRLLVKCHAGCSQQSVIDALRDKDLWPKKSNTKTWRVLKYVPEGTIPPNDMKHYKLGAPSHKWEYKDYNGKTVGYIYRFDKPEGGKELMPLAYCQADEDGSRQFRWKSFDKPRPLYGEYLLKGNQKPVLIVEGEKTKDAAEKLFPDLVVISWPGGGNAAKFANWEVLKDRVVTIWPDADEPGIKCATNIAEILIAAKAKEVKTVFPPEGLPKGWDLADEVPEDVKLDIQLAYQTAVSFEPSGDMKIDEMNRNYALTILGDKAVIIWERWDEAKKRFVPHYVGKQAVKDHLANQFVPAGRKEVPLFDYWMTHPARKTYDGVVFEPGLETPKYFNLWRDFTVAPDNTGDWSMLKEHIMQNIVHGDESQYNWIMAWFAQMLQDPRNKPGTSITIKGKQGTGKTIIGDMVGYLIRDNYVLVDQAEQVTGKFNSHMGHSLLLQADEGFFGGDPRITGRLKSLVTSNTNRIEPKGKDSFEINNYIRFMITSNERWVVPAAFEERRFAVFNASDDRMQDRSYFKAMTQQMQSGGYEGLLHDLLNWDLSTTDVGVIPETLALAEQKEQSLDTVARFWFERLESAEITQSKNEWPVHVGCEELYEAYIRRCMQWGIPRRQSAHMFTTELGDLTEGGFEKERARISVPDDRGYTQEKVQWCYKLPAVDKCRKMFETALGNRVEWPLIDTKSSPEKTDDIPF